MPGVETAVVAAGRAIAERAMREWLAVRAARRDRETQLKDLIQSGFRDRLAPRKFGNQLDGIAMAVESRLRDLVEQEYRDLDEAARAAVLLEVVEALRATDLSDRALFDADADPARLAARVLDTVAPPRLGADEDALYGVLLAECVACLVGMMQQLPQYLPRAQTESLARLSGLAEGMERVLARLPARTLEAPEGTRDDHAFEQHYLAFLSRTLDEIELFGVPMETYRPRTSLSVAYISLNVSTGQPRRSLERLAPASLTGRDESESGSRRIESALTRRTLVRGEAGSGKSTLLRWLAVTAARRGFTGDLSSWNGCVPFMVKLRSHADGRLPAPSGLLDDVAQEVAGLMPRGWAERVLASGRGLLLVDGVDELRVRHRQAVRQWLGRLLAANPELRVVVTSRPAAADVRWLADDGFAAALLEPMTPQDLGEFIGQWHVAMRACPSLPCEPGELRTYERALLARLESTPHLRLLAATPLLAAMICALNLDRRTQLPRSRMGLYEAVLALLLERRDAERGIQDDIVLDPEQKIWILRDLAWRVVSMGRSELAKATALRRIEQRLTGMTRMPYQAADVLDYLLRRSGVIREPVPGRIDFAHKTVQEYLAAGQLVEDDDVEAAVERAHLDQWREVVVMTAGHATGRGRRDLLRGLLDRAEEGGRHARRLRLLVASCLETLREIPVELRDRVEACLTKVIPPRSEDEARILAAAGEEILRRVPDDLSGFTENQAMYTVRMTGWINGEDALRKLAAWSGDTRWAVGDTVVRMWPFFEPDRYAREVVASSSVLPWITVTDTSHLPCLGRLSRMTGLKIEPRVDSLEFLTDTPQLVDLELDDLACELTSVRHLAGLNRLWFQQWSAEPMDMTPITTLTELHTLCAWCGHDADLGFLDRIPRLDELGLNLPEGDAWTGALSRQTELSWLSVYGAGQELSPSVFAGWRALRHLSVTGLRNIPACLDALADAGAPLTGLSLYATDITDLSVLAKLPLLTRVSLSSDLDRSPLEALPNLKVTIVR
ncbi:NACHT domain-containing protein [Nonomuraea typhae]|uniref:NACHT domain-containing protein n=1 Tax=Nonomuraea typhae TaxID=2603600 RepID=UPI0012F78E0F|nr:NACHT domain-containing protein [Nonomuraea typhae]